MNVLDWQSWILLAQFRQNLMLWIVFGFWGLVGIVLVVRWWNKLRDE